jgi:hypothetical protein
LGARAPAAQRLTGANRNRHRDGLGRDDSGSGVRQCM